MTHQELLDHIDQLDDSCSAVGITTSILRSIVKLHIPYEINWHSIDMLSCDGCGQMYPCQTIMAIELGLTTNS